MRALRASPPVRLLAIACGIVAFFAWWGLRPVVRVMPESGPIARLASPDAAHALTQVFISPVATMTAVTVTAQAEQPARLIWTLDLASGTDVFRHTRRAASGAAAVAPGRHAIVLTPATPLATSGSEVTLTMWFEGAGAAGAELESSGLDCYPGRLIAGQTSLFGDLRLALSGPNLYSDLQLRLAGGPAWSRAPFVHAAGIIIFLAALTGFVADVTAARGEQG